MAACAKSRRGRHRVRAAARPRGAGRRSPTPTTCSSATATGFIAAPATRGRAGRAGAEHPDATVVAGATDVGLWITKQMRAHRQDHRPRPRRAASTRSPTRAMRLTIGAGATCARPCPSSRPIDPDLGELIRRFGSAQVRATGTVGGNIANGSPIGDLAPALIALGAELELRRGERVRSMPLETFFLDYGKQDREPGELVTGILIARNRRAEPDLPLLQGVETLRRGHLVGDGRLPPDGRRGRVDREARIAYGGMAGDATAGERAEHALTGAPLRDSRAAGRGPARPSREDFTPIDDHRASPATAPRRRMRSRQGADRDGGSASTGADASDRPPRGGLAWISTTSSRRPDSRSPRPPAGCA